MAPEHEHNVPNTLVVHAGPRSEWSTTMCDCSNRPISLCLYAWFCPPCQAASTRTEYDDSNCIFNFLAVNPFMVRNIIRNGYGIEGSACGDICTTVWCGPCAMAQVMHEVRTRGPMTKPGGASHEWKHGLCSFDFGACCYAYCFPCCAMTEARKRFDESGCCFNFLCSNVALTRNIIRQGYGLEGDCCTDLLFAYFLPICVLAQLLQETKYRGHVAHVKPQTQQMQ